MKAMNNSVQTVLLLLLGFIKVLVCKEFYISQNGSDVFTCGSATNKCKSFAFLFSNKIYSTTGNDSSPALVTIFVDGGLNAPFVYDIQATIPIGQSNIEIKRTSESIFYPILQASSPQAGRPPSVKSIYAFQSLIDAVDNTTSVTVSFSSIHFRNVNIWQCDASICNINLKNCTITNGKASTTLAPRDSPVIRLLTDSSASINIEKTLFDLGQASALYAEPRSINAVTNMSIKDSHFKGCQIQFHTSNLLIQSGTLNMNFSNVEVTDLRNSFLEIKGNVKSMSISHTKFENNELQIGSDLISINTDYSVISIQLYNLSIVHNRFGAGIMSLSGVTTHTKFELVTIKNNTFYDTMIDFNNCMFIDFKNVTIAENIAEKDIMSFKYSSNVSLTHARVKKNMVKGNFMSVASGDKVKISQSDFEDNIIGGDCFQIKLSTEIKTWFLQFRRNVIKSNFFSVNASSAITLRDTSLHNNKATGYWHGLDAMIVIIGNIKFISNAFEEYLFSTKNSTIMTTSINNNNPLHYNISSVQINNTNAIYGFQLMLQKSAVEKIVIDRCVFNSSVIDFQNSEDVELKNIEISQTKSSGSIVTVDTSRTLTFANMNFLGNQVENSIIYIENSYVHKITNMTAIDNEMKSTVLSVWFSELSTTNVYIAGNKYHTGVSITNSDAVITGLHIEDNLSRGSTKELYYTEYYEFRDEIPRKQYHCFFFLEKKITLKNVNITTSVDTSSYKKNYVVSFFLIVPKVLMENVTINLNKHQTAAMEMYVNIRDPTALKPDVRVFCPVGATPQEGRDTSFELTYKYQIYCQPCPQNFYSVDRGRIYINNITEGIRRLFNTNNDVVEKMVVAEIFEPKCQNCSVGGVCQNGLSVSRGNFYGYTVENIEVMNHSSQTLRSVVYKPCPTHYCCSERDGTLCKNMDTCMPGRAGVLCGHCKPGFQENFFNTSCISTKNCQKRIEFWIVFVITVFIIFFVNCFLDLVGPAIRAVILFFKKILKLVVKRRNKRKYYVNKGDVPSDRKSVQFQSSLDDIESGNTAGISHHNLTYADDATKNDGHDATDEKNEADETKGPVTKQDTASNATNLESDVTSTDNKSIHDDAFTSDSAKLWKFHRHISSASENCLIPSEMENEGEEEDSPVNNKNVLDNVLNLSRPPQAATSIKKKSSSKRTKLRQGSLRSNSNSIKKKNESPITVEDNEKTFTVGGVFQAFVSFYQVRSLIHVDSVSKYSFSEVMGDIFNGGLFFNFAATFCPYLNLGVADKIFIRYVVFFLMMLVMLIILAITYTLYKKLKETFHHDEAGDVSKSLSFKHRLEVCYSRIFLFNFKNLAFFCIISLNCIEIKNTSVLFINGTSQCFQPWQYAAMVFLAVWVIPFPFALFASFHLYQHHRITYHEKMVCLTFPFATFWYFVKRHLFRSSMDRVNLNEHQFEYVLKMYVEPFRLIEGETDKYVFWEHWRLLQRLILSVLSVVIIDPLEKVTSMVPCIVVFAVVYVKIHPFNKQFTLLHWLEVTSLLGYFFIIVLNLFKGLLYVYNITDTFGIEMIIRIFSFGEIAFSPLFVIVVFMAISFMHNHFADKKKNE